LPRDPIRRRHWKILFVLILSLCLAASAAAQRGRFGFRLPPNPPYDGAFQFCRAIYERNPHPDGGGWTTDYPQADVNFPYRLAELTMTPVSKDSRRNPNHVIVGLADPELYRCPMIMMYEVGALYFDEEDAGHLRDYLLKGGFLWVDDFWGEYAWRIWETEIRKVLPAGEYPMMDIPLAHPLFHVLYQVNEIPQIPSINYWFGSGGRTSERADSQVPHVRGIFDRRGNLMVLITHNTDFGDAFEREGENRAYFDRFAGVGYAFGINAALYAMTH
jgi:hypothetical protein